MFPSTERSCGFGGLVPQGINLVHRMLANDMPHQVLTALKVFRAYFARKFIMLRSVHFPDMSVQLADVLESFRTRIASVAVSQRSFSNNSKGKFHLVL